MEMTYKEAVLISAQHIVDFIDDYDKDDVANILKDLKINLLACVNGFSNERIGILDEDKLFYEEI